MFTSDTDRKSAFKSLIFFVIFTAFMALFGAIYEIFSHGVYSYFMIYAFAFSLVLGVIPHLFIALYGKVFPKPISKNCWNHGVITLTVGSAFYGVLDIFGTTNFTVLVYLSIGSVLIITGLTTFIVTIVKEGKNAETSYIEDENLDEDNTEDVDETSEEVIDEDTEEVFEEGAEDMEEVDAEEAFEETAEEADND
ncbi:MAG: hypothetical protein J6U25_03635 [Clostridia bacterium]|nr:hypothetical protein [Clostridia bacterium]